MNLETIQAKIAALPGNVRDSPERLFPVICELYRSVRIEGVSLEDDGDMLLFQWGTNDWGQGANFELDLTRQVIPAGVEDPPIMQLRYTYQYAAASFSDIDAGNRWCSSPGNLAEFERFVRGSEAMRRVSACAHASLRILLNDAE